MAVVGAALELPYSSWVLVVDHSRRVAVVESHADSRTVVVEKTAVAVDTEVVEN